MSVNEYSENNGLATTEILNLTTCLTCHPDTTILTVLSKFYPLNGNHRKPYSIHYEHPRLSVHKVP